MQAGGSAGRPKGWPGEEAAYEEGSLWRRQPVEKAAFGEGSRWRRQPGEVACGDSLWRQPVDSPWRQPVEADGGGGLRRQPVAIDNVRDRPELSRLQVPPRGGITLVQGALSGEPGAGGLLQGSSAGAWGRTGLGHCGRGAGQAGAAQAGCKTGAVQAGGSAGRPQGWHVEEAAHGEGSLWRRQPLEKAACGEGSLWERKPGEVACGGSLGRQPVDSLWRQPAEAACGGSLWWQSVETARGGRRRGRPKSVQA